MGGICSKCADGSRESVRSDQQRNSANGRGFSPRGTSPRVTPVASPRDEELVPPPAESSLERPLERFQPTYQGGQRQRLP